MRELIAWTIPILVSLFVIHFAADMLYLRAAAQQQAIKASQRGAPQTQRDSIRGPSILGPVHEVERDVTEDGIIT